MARLIVVSNRVAVPSRDGGNQAGGLAVAVRSCSSATRASGSAGAARFRGTGDIATSRPSSAATSPMSSPISREADYQEYYNGFANRVLWPILHYRLDLAEFSRRDLSGYRRVNEHFATQLHKLLKPDDIIWVHDYHLIPLAKMLRDRGHRNRIGFFLHVPFPPPEILTALPNHEWLIPQLSAYDLVGFQTDERRGQFRALSRKRMPRCRSAATAHSRADRTVRIGVFPDRHRDRRVQPAGAALGALAARAQRARKPRRAHHDDRRRPARLFQGPCRSAWMPSSGFSRSIRTGTAR